MGLGKVNVIDLLLFIWAKDLEGGLGVKMKFWVKDDTLIVKGDFYSLSSGLLGGILKAQIPEEAMINAVITVTKAKSAVCLN